MRTLAPTTGLILEWIGGILAALGTAPILVDQLAIYKISVSLGIFSIVAGGMGFSIAMTGFVLRHTKPK